MSALPFVVGISGASGAPYAQRLIRCLNERNIPVHLLVTGAGRQVIKEELDIELGSTPADTHAGLKRFIAPDYDKRVKLHALDDWNSPLASGSFQTNAMVVIPCSVHSLSAIANGHASNLLERRADIMLKDRKKLVIVFREMPLNSIHLEHLLKLSNMGAHIFPAMPGFYHHPKTIDDMIDFVVGRVLDTLDIPNALYRRWGEHERTLARD